MPKLIQPSFPDHDAGSNKKLKMLIELWWPKETARRAREVAEDQGEHPLSMCSSEAISRAS